MVSLNKPTYHRRLFLWLLGYSAILVTGMALFQFLREKEFKAEELNSRLQMINANILYDLEHNKKDRLSGDLSWTGISGLRISILDKNGHVLSDNTLDSIPETNHFNREEIAEALRDGEGYTIRRHSELTDDSYFYSAKAGSEYIVRSAVPYTTNLSDLLAADYTIIWIMGGLTMAMCIGGFFATRRLGQNIAKLNRFAKAAEKGEPIEVAEAFPHDELGEISNHIVRLYAHLQQAIVQRDKEHRAALHHEQEKILIKRQLTNNINHELKTPVAAMQVCLETLMCHPDLSEKVKAEFMERCLAANHRLVKLMEDVSAITRMEDGSSAISREIVDVGSLVADICSESEPAAEEKGIEIINKIPNDFCLEGNSSLTESIFRNLIDNAIAYSEGNYIELNVFENSRGNQTFTVADNGIGVAPEHLPRLFERFYRVDKGRSRQAGGTGLGLSIVRNAVSWHGGNIRVENRPSGGLLFTFTLQTAGS